MGHRTGMLSARARVGAVRGSAAAMMGFALALASTHPAVAQVPAASTNDAAVPVHKDCDTCIILLGTRGGPVVDPARSEPATLLVVNGTPYEIDAGAGAARQIVAAGYPLASLRTIFLTHHHLDHTAGLEPLMSLTWISKALANRDLRPIDVYGPPATAFLVNAALNYLSVSERIFRAGIPDLASSRKMFVGHDMQPGVIYRDANITVTAVANAHFGHPSRGPDAKQDLSFSYRFDTPNGSIVFTGDTGPDPAVTALAKDATILVSEVTLPRSGSVERVEAGVGRQLADHLTHEHLTPADVGKMAAEAGVKRVVLSHLAIPSNVDAKDRLIEGVRQYFLGPVSVGEDLQVFKF